MITTVEDYINCTSGFENILPSKVQTHPAFSDMNHDYMSGIKADAFRSVYSECVAVYRQPEI